MKVRMKQAVLALFLISNSGSLFAVLVDGNKLSEWSNNQDQAGFESGLFEGYVAGVLDVGNNLIFCTTSDVKREQLNAIVAKFLKNNPEQWNEPASILVIDSIRSEFPCEE